MGWVLFILTLLLGIALYLKGFLIIRTETKKNACRTYFETLLDSLDDMEEKAVYGEDSARIVRVLRTVAKNAAFEMCGYDVLVDLDTRPKKSERVQVDIGKRATAEKMEQVRAINEKRMAEVFGNG